MMAKKGWLLMPWPRRQGLRGGVFTLAVLLPALLSHAAQWPLAANLPATAEAIEGRIAELVAAEDLDEAIRSRALDIYRQAQREAQLAAGWEARLSEWETKVQRAPQELERIREELAASRSATVPEIHGWLSLERLEDRLRREEAELAAAKAVRDQVENEFSTRTTRRLDIPRRLEELRTRLEEVGTQPPPPAPEEPAVVHEAHRALHEMRRRALERERSAKEREMAAYTATGDLLISQRDLAARRVALAEQTMQRVQERLNARRRLDAEAQIEQADLEAARASRAERELAMENVELAKQRLDLLQRLETVVNRVSNVQQRLGSVRQQFQRARDRVETVGMTNAVGLLLRRERSDLPDDREHRRAVRSRNHEIPTVQNALFELEDRRLLLGDLEAASKKRLGELDREDLMETEAAAERIHTLLETQRGLVDVLIGEYRTYLERLTDIDGAERQLIEEIDQYSTFINEHVLWIRSSPLLGVGGLKPLVGSVTWLFDPEGSRQVAETFVDDARANPLLWMLVGSGFVLLIGLQRRLRRRVLEVGERASRATDYRFLPTVQALIYTVLLACTWPALLGVAGWRLLAGFDEVMAVRAAAAGLLAAAWFSFPLELFRQVCRPMGLAEVHFGWPEGAVRTLRRHLRWLLLASILPVAVAVAMQAQDDPRWQDSLGRIAFITVLLLVALFAWRLLRPHGEVARAFLAENPHAGLARFRHIWLFFGVVAPLILVGLAVSGYYYTAWQLMQRLWYTSWLFAGLLLLGSLVLRWVLLLRRRLAIEQARRRAALAQQAETSGEAAGPMADLAPKESEADLSAINRQSRRLVYVSLAVAAVVGLWVIWVDVTPALAFFRHVPLWETTVESSEEVLGAEGEAISRVVEQRREVTLADLALAVLVASLAFAAARNLPGLMEISLLPYLPLDSGLRYAISTVSRYVIVLVGVVMTLGLVGIGWSKVQWLVAAISVGLGFGLQEIFGNFVSGLVLLFERPIRPGDVVTIGDVTGLVSKIRIRATTIVTWDRKEFIVPNKEFITGRLLNWTLTDQLNRITIEVGVSYQSDPEAVRAKIREIAESQPEILADPAPMVTFEQFGDSALKFVLRCFLDGLNCRLEVIHQLHSAIHREFAAAGIEIAYPQLDLHVRTAPVRQGLPQDLEIA